MSTEITVIEETPNSDPASKPYRSVTRPNFHEPVYPVVAEFIWKASAALTKFRNEWLEEHNEHDYPFGHGLEMDVLPVMTDGSIMGYMALSEVDSETYDFFPTKSVEERPTL